MDPGEPHWRINSSFSPPLSRQWDCRLHSDGLLSQGTHRAPVHESSFLLHIKERRSGDSNQYPIHSDAALSSRGSPTDGFPPLQWPTPEKTLDLCEFSTHGGPRPETSISSQCNIEGHFPGGASSMSNSIGSASPCSESSDRRTFACKQSIFLPPRNFSGRRLFISKPVYPLIFHNPISDYEANDMVIASSIDSKIPPVNSSSTFNLDLKFQNSLTELQKMEASPEPGASSRREGFRLSNASSYYDSGYEVDAIDITEHITTENLMLPNNSARNHKCGLCEKFLWQKPPCSSYKFVRNYDLPIAAVLPCGHIFHADCFEEITPKNIVCDSSCPQCLKSVTFEGSTSISDPLKDINFSHIAGTGIKRRGFLIKDHLIRRFSNNLFGAKVFRRNASSSSSASVNNNTL